MKVIHIDTEDTVIVSMRQDEWFKIMGDKSPCVGEGYEAPNVAYAEGRLRVWHEKIGEMLKGGGK